MTRVEVTLTPLEVTQTPLPLVYTGTVLDSTAVWCPGTKFSTANGTARE